MNKFNRSSFRCFSILFFLLISSLNHSYSQTDSTLQKKWSITVFGGLMIPQSDYIHAFDISPNIGIEASYNFNPFLSIYFNGTYIFLNIPDYTIEFANGYAAARRLKATDFEIISGGKYNFSNSLPRFYSEAGLGYYETNFYNIDEYKLHNLGINLGIGFEFDIYKNVLANLKLKYTDINTPKDNSPATYFGFYSGIKYMF